MNKTYLLFVFLILLVPSVLASTPNFDVTQLFIDEVSNGEVDFGELLFLERQYGSDIHTLNTISNLQVQKYDILEWNGGYSIKIKNSNGLEQILVTGSEYYFSESGIHYIISMANESNYATIVVDAEDEIFIDIEDIDVPVGFDLTLEPMSFILNDERVVNAVLNVDDDVEPDDYQISYKINDEIYTKTFEVIENINWTMNLTNFTSNITVPSGQGLYVGRIIVENTGNKDIEILVQKVGNESGILSIPQPQTLYRKNIIALDFQLQIPRILKAGDYDLEIVISGGNITKRVPLNISVTDSIFPTIDSIEFSSDNVFVNNDIKVYATDNNNVKNLTLTFDGQTYPFNKDGNLFTRTFMFTKISRYVLTFCAEDEQGNKFCEEINKTFEKMNVIDGYEKVLNMNAMKYGKYSNIFLFNITGNLTEDIVVELVNYNSVPKLENNSVIFRIVDEDGSIKTFSKYEGQVIISEPGVYYFEVRADEEVDIDGVLRFNIPEQYEGLADSTFKVSFKDYEVPQDFEIAWVNGRDLICEVEDTGNLETSEYKCLLTYPISVRPEDISVPTTVSERDNFENEANKVREELNDVKTKNAWVLGITIGILVIVILVAIFYVLWYPYLRIQTGKTIDDKKL